jgi:hypothetical protein
VQHSIDADFPPAQRVQCLKLLGSLFEVGAFVERKEITTINKASDIRARLLQVLGNQAQDIEPKTIDDSGTSLLEELAAGAPLESGQGEPHPEGAPQIGHGPEGLYTHTVSDIGSPENSDMQSKEKSTEDSFDAP